MNPPTAQQIVETILQAQRTIHLDEFGNPANWGLDTDTLVELGKVLRPGWVTAETGAGGSTILCSAVGRRHFVVCPDPAEIVRIRKVLADHALPDHLVPLVQSSDVALPGLASMLGGELLDLALIDGAHRYPFPILDWHYFAPPLRVDGWMLVDDIQIPSVGVLLDYLKQDDDWRLEKVTGKTAWFRKLRDEVIVDEWTGQTINRNLASGDDAIPTLGKLREQIALKFKHAIGRRVKKFRS